MGEATRQIIANPAAAARLLAPLLDGLAAEELHVVHLDPGNQVLGMSRHEGPFAHAVEVPIRRIVREALELDSAAILIAHNHPGGDPEPSAADLAVTRRLAETMRALGVRVVDHLVVAAREVRSFRALGLL